MKKFTIISILALTFSTSIFACGEGNEQSRSELSSEVEIQKVVQAEEPVEAEVSVDGK